MRNLGLRLSLPTADALDQSIGFGDVLRSDAFNLSIDEDHLRIGGRSLMDHIKMAPRPRGASSERTIITKVRGCDVCTLK